MKVEKVIPQGYCGGVRNAIKLALDARIKYPDKKITILGNLVHNQYVKKALELKGIDTIENPAKTRVQLLEDIDEGVVIFTAHGVNDEVRKKAESKNLITIDASCPFVLNTQKIVKDKLRQGSKIFYIGKNRHPEAESIYTLSDQVYLIEKEEDIPKNIQGEIFVTNQTTISLLDIQHLFDEIRAYYPSAEICDELCNATRVRQEALLNLDPKVFDTVVVVGDPSSNNTRQLEKTAKKAGISRTILAETIEDIYAYDFSDDESIAITSGASTPSYLMEQIYQYLQSGKKDSVCLTQIL